MTIIIIRDTMKASFIIVFSLFLLLVGNVVFADQTIQYVSLTPENNAYQNLTTIYINVTSNETLSNTSYLEWRNTTGPGINYTLNISGNASYSLTGLEEGYHTYKVWLNSSQTNLTQESVLRNITIDLTLPTLLVQFPEDIIYNYNKELPLNYTFSEDTIIDKIWYYVMPGNPEIITFVNGNNATFNVTPDTQQRNLILNANDTAGNVKYVRTNFSIDMTNPVLVVQSPENIAYGQSNISLNYTVQDTFFGVDTCWWINATGGNNTLSGCGNTTMNLTNGDYTIQVWVNDTGGNYNWAEINFTIDLIAPNLSIQLPQNATYYYNNSLPLNYTVNDTNLDKVWYNIDGGSNVFVDGQNATFNVSEGPHSINLFANDSIGIVVFESVNFSIDVPPSLSINSPQNITYGQSNISLDYTVNGYDIDSCWWVNATNGNNTLPNCQNITMLLTDGYYTGLQIWVNDSVGNYSWAEVNFSVDLPPSLSLQFPQSTTYYYNTSLSLNYTTSDTNLDKCWYNIDEGNNITLVNCTNTTFNASEDSHTLYLFVNDTTNNTVSISVSFNIDLTPSTTTTTVPVASGSPPATTTTTTIPPQKSQSFSEMNPNVSYIAKIVHEYISFKEIILEVNNNANDVKITVTKLDSKPATIFHQITGTVYQYINITKDNLNDDNIKSAKIRFNVSKTWIIDNNYNIEDAVLNRYTNSWDNLPTIVISQDGNNVEYEAETPGFSIFAISFEDAETTTTIPPETTITQTTTTIVTTTTTEAENLESSAIYGIYLLIIVIIVVSAGILYSKMIK